METQPFTPESIEANPRAEVARILRDASESLQEAYLQAFRDVKFSPGGRSQEFVVGDRLYRLRERMLEDGSTHAGLFVERTVASEQSKKQVHKAEVTFEGVSATLTVDGQKILGIRWDTITPEQARAVAKTFATYEEDLLSTTKPIQEEPAKPEDITSLLSVV